MNASRPRPDTESIAEWLQDKYVLRKYIMPLPTRQDDIQKQVVFAIQERDRRSLLVCLMNASKEQLNMYYDAEKDTRTPLMLASCVGDVVAVQLLLWAGVDTSIKNDQGVNAYDLTCAVLNDIEAKEDAVKRVQDLLRLNTIRIQRLVVNGELEEDVEL